MEISFENIEEVRKHTDPDIFYKAVGSTVKTFSDKAATLVNKEVLKSYPVKAGDIRKVLKKKYTANTAIPERLLIYASERISLSKFATRASRPVVKSARGERYGARVSDRKGRGSRIVKGGFWGTAMTSGSQQIFKREGAGRLKIKKLTGPSISQMVRGTDVLKVIQKHIEDNANPLLRKNLDFFQARKTGTR